MTGSVAEFMAIHGHSMGATHLPGISPRGNPKAESSEVEPSRCSFRKGTSTRSRSVNSARPLRSVKQDTMYDM